jgi:hypothetical protein
MPETLSAPRHTARLGTVEDVGDKLMRKKPAFAGVTGLDNGKQACQCHESAWLGFREPQRAAGGLGLGERGRRGRKGPPEPPVGRPEAGLVGLAGQAEGYYNQNWIVATEACPGKTPPIRHRWRNIARRRSAFTYRASPHAPPGSAR